MLEPIRADLSGKTCLVTGASAGIGRATARALAGLGARVVMAVRDPEKGERARREVTEAAARPEVEVLPVDLARQDSIRAFAREVRARFPRIDVLVNNAGTWSERRKTSPDGIELTWATNVLGGFLLTDLLLPAVRAAGGARVVNVASRLAGGLDLSDVQFERRRYSGQAAYAQSKQANRMLTWALARRLAGSGATANAMTPGFVATEIFAKGGGPLSLVLWLYSKLAAKKPAEGADTLVWLAASPEVEGRRGLFWSDRQEQHCRFRDEAAEEELWRLCERMTGVGARPAGPAA
jgi:NAD(P)-dependent dehydrogenase (short-subunit alcohol dehydrogenase family)